MVRSNQTEIKQSSGAGDSFPDRLSLLREADKRTIRRLTKQGWVLLHRQFWDDEDFPEESFTELQAWAWLFSEACYEDKTVRFKNQAIPLKRGQLATSIRILAKRFKWGRIKTDSYLRKLEKFGKILRQPKDRDYTILTIYKYECYQNVKDNQMTGIKTMQRQPDDNPQPRLKKYKEIKELKEVLNDIKLEKIKITESEYERLKTTYSDIDVDYEIIRADNWCIGHGSRGNKEKWFRFLDNWLKNDSCKKLDKPKQTGMTQREFYKQQTERLEREKNG